MLECPNHLYMAAHACPDQDLLKESGNAAQHDLPEAGDMLVKGTRVQCDCHRQQHENKSCCKCFVT